MLKKIIVLLLFPAMFFVKPCCAQAMQNTEKNGQLVISFNQYLSAVHLNEVIKAKTFTFQKATPIPGQSSLKPVTAKYILQIGPTISEDDPLAFNEKWQQLIKELNGRSNIYQELFLKLCDLTQQNPDSLAIQINTRRTDIFSVLVYYQREIRVAKTLSGTRGSQPTARLTDPADLDNGLFGIVFQKVPIQSDPVSKLTAAISNFLKRTADRNTKAPVIVQSKHWGDGIHSFTANNIIGRVTGKYHEMISVTLTIVKSADQKTADVAVSFSIYYASNPMDAENVETYENALRSYKGGVARFGATLKDVLKNTLYDRKI